MAFTVKTPWLSHFFASIRAGLTVFIASLAAGVASEHCQAQTDDKPASAETSQEPSDSTPVASPESSSTAKADLIPFDAAQKEPLLQIVRQQLVNKRLTFQPVFELFADGKLTNRRGSRTEKTIQLTPEEVQSILQQAIGEAKFFSLDAAKFQKQFTQAAIGNKSFRVKDQAITKIEVKVKQGQKTLAIRGYSLARLKLTELVEFQKLTAVESICEYLIAKNVVGSRSPEILAAINAEIKNRNLPLPEIKGKDLRAAYERTGGRFQARYFALTIPKANLGGDPKPKNPAAAENKFEPQPVRITYFVKSQGAPPTISFFGNTGE